VYAGLVAFVVFLAAAALVWTAFGDLVHAPHKAQRAPTTAQHAPTDPWSAYEDGWTQLPDPPQIRSGASEVWTGSEYLYWGGTAQGSKDPSATGYSFDPKQGRWAAIPRAPEGMTYAQAVWTGSVAIFWGGNVSSDPGQQLEGFAYEPVAESWKRVPAAPIDGYGRKVVWTGTEMLAWGAGKGGDPLASGAAFDPSSWDWHPIADAPIALNAFTAVWTGNQAVVFGAELNSKNRSTSPTALGAAYSPVSDTWETLPPSALSPQASTLAWVDGRLIAYDYGLDAAELDPISGHWKGLPHVPMTAGECYPDSAVVGATLVAFYCGQGATWNLDTGWVPISGGLMDETVAAYGSQIQLYRFADLTPAGSVLVFAAEGITVNNHETACYGCSGAPHQFWVYRPPPPASPTPTESPTLRPGAAHIKVSPGESRTFPPGELHTGDVITCPGRGEVTVTVPGQQASSSIGLMVNRGLNGGVLASCDGKP
jgi:hypothetical protein